MADILTFDDVCTQYKNNLVTYKDRPVKVFEVDREGRTIRCEIYDLQAQKRSWVNFNLKDFNPPRFRLGMVNIGSDCVFLSRIPMRKMQVGITRNTLSIGVLPYEYKDGLYHSQTTAQNLCSEGFYECISNTYLPFEDAIETAKNSKGVRGFDKQFAVGGDRKIFYKTNLVGTIPKGKSQLSEIEFSNEWKYLSVLLENNHEKTVGIVCA